jgi:hypothetical protein
MRLKISCSCAALLLKNNLQQRCLAFSENQAAAALPRFF